MKHFIILSFFLFSLDSNSIELPEDIACQGKILELAKRWKVSGEWKTRGNESFLAKTDIFGDWMIVQEAEKSVSAIKENQVRSIAVTFDKATCRSQMKVVEKTKANQQKKDLIGRKLLDDRKIEGLVKEGQGIFYFLSPHMPLSINGIESISKAAKKYHLNVTFIVDPRTTNQVKIDKIARDHSLLQVYQTNSFEFLMRNAYIHFPAVFFYADGKILDFVKYGYEADYSWDIKRVFKK